MEGEAAVVIGRVVCFTLSQFRATSIIDSDKHQISTREGPSLHEYTLNIHAKLK